MNTVIVEGWSYYFIELALTGFAMLGGLAFAESISERDGPRQAIAASVALTSISHVPKMHTRDSGGKIATNSSSHLQYAFSSR